MKIAAGRGVLGLSIATMIALAAVAFPTSAFADDAVGSDEVAVAAGEPASADPSADPAVEAPEAPEPAEPVGAVEPGDSAEPAGPAAPVSDASEPVAEAPIEESAPPAVVVVDAESTTTDEVFADDAAVPTVTLFDDAPEVAAAPAPGDPCYPAVCITNGTVLLAVNPTGELNTSDATGSAAGPGDAGLGYLPTNNDSTSPGCLCEGWGVADPTSRVWGGANLAEEGAGGTNLVLESFDWTDAMATSVVLVTDDEDQPYFRVTHEYIPSAETPNLYQVNVTIENLSGQPIATVQYRRVMDWDVEPTAFSEFVTIDRGSASALTYVSDDGFASSNPLSGPSSILGEGNMTDSGPSDHGALFDFSFGGLDVGGTISFVIFYGAAADQAGAEAALAAVGAEAYSFGQTADDPEGGSPNTFIFAFGKVGGSAIFAASAATPLAPPVVEAPTPVTAVVAEADSVESALAVTGIDAGWSAPSGFVLAGAGLLAGGLLLLALRRRVAQSTRP